MGKSTNGPDWTDVETMMRALEAVHSGRVEVTVSPAGTGSSGGVSVACKMAFNVLPGSSVPATVSVVNDWPCNAHRELTDHVFDGLHRLDFEISKVYENQSLWQ